MQANYTKYLMPKCLSQPLLDNSVKTNEHWEKKSINLRLKGIAPQSTKNAASKGKDLLKLRHRKGFAL